MSEAEKMREVYKRAELLNLSGNPLVAKSIEACRRISNSSLTLPLGQGLYYNYD